jgi:NADH-quinone oxidoreductase subunit F
LHRESLVEDIISDELSEDDLLFIENTIKDNGKGPEAVIPILQCIQDHYRYLPEKILRHITEISYITPAQITGVSTFYSQFRHHPVGQHIISVCHGTACHVKGSGIIQDALYRHLNIHDGEDTDAEKLFTVQKVACLGCCTLAPVIQIDGITYGHLTPDIVPKILRDFLSSEGLRAKGHGVSTIQYQEPSQYPASSITEIRLGLGSCCIAKGSGNVRDALMETIRKLNIKAKVKRVGCVGICHQTPLVEIVTPDGRSFLYANVLPEDIEPIILRHVKPGGIIKKISKAASDLVDKIMVDKAWEPIARYSISVRDPEVSAFLDKQKHIATEHYGNINPTDLDEYLKTGGFDSLKKCVTELTPEQVIEEINKSGLRGRGGAGFPTGIKWSLVKDAKSDEKYVICNGDEGDPGAFMDRMLLESYPYRIIEGIAIAAYAVGANKGYLYIRAEYPLAVQRISEALDICMERGFWGDNLFGSNFSLHLKIMEGAGAFICGEETAMLESIEGNRGMPRLRPPYPAESGLWGKPTLINNVETYSLVPWIIRNGADVFASLGVGKSKGTKVFALAGKIERGGLIEVPMGITIREIIEDIGGGVANEKRFKAVQIGGPSGGCIPAELSYTTVDYEALASLGAIMGSGGLVVLDDSDCMVEIARYFLQFTQDQSCGKCTFCRVGTKRMLEILENLCNGHGKEGDLEELEYLANMVKKGSLCGLGKTAPNPVITTLKYFRAEYEAHLEKRCPAGKCRSLIQYVVTDDCIGCTLCAQHCPVDAIEMKPYEKHVVDDKKCTRCDTCKQICPKKAIIIISEGI